MRRHLTRAIAAALLLAPLSACSIVDSYDDKGEPIPTDIAPEKREPSFPDPSNAKTRDPNQGEAVAQVLRHKLEQDVITQAKLDRPISSACTKTGDKAYDCTVTFDGQPVRHTVAIQEVTSWGSMGTNVRYTITSRDVVITKRATQLAMLQMIKNSQQRSTKYTNPRCDAALPEVSVIPDKADLEKHHCYAIGEGWGQLTELFYISGTTSGPTVYHK